MDGFIGAILVIGLYFAPTIVAAHRKVPDVGKIFVINLTLGWLMIPWFITMGLALGKVEKTSPTAPDPKSHRFSANFSKFPCRKCGLDKASHRKMAGTGPRRSVWYP